MRKTFFAFALFTLTLVFTAISCSKDKDSGVDYAANADCTGVDDAANSYTAAIKPILDGSCAIAGCHDAVTAAEGIDLSSYAASKNAFEKKQVLCSIHHGSGCTPMPQGADQLSAATIKLIDCWVKNDYVQ